MTPASPGALVAFRSRDYRVFWLAAIVSNSGNWMQTITVPYVILRMTHSTTWVGFAAFMAFGPALAMGPLAGSLADRYPRKQVVLVTQALMMIAAFALFALWVSDAATPESIVAILLVSGIGSGLGIASWQSFIPQLVPTEHMLSAIRLNSVQFTAARAFGPALAGLVLAELGPSVGFLFNAVSFLLVLVALLAIHPRAIDLPVVMTGSLEHFRAGVRYVRERQALLLPVLTIFVVSFFGSSVIQLCAPLARRVFDVGKAEYGLMVAAFGLGAVFGTFFTLAFGDRIRRSRLAMIGLVLFAVGEMLLGGAPAYAAGVVGLFGMGFAYMFIAVSLNTSIQARVEESHRGRVLSIYLMGLLAGVPFGALLGGAVADFVGLRATVIGGGTVVLAFAVFAALVYDAMGPLNESIDESEPVHADALLTTQPTIAGAD
ncbi:MAG: MFS transporter [Acidimicrobiia bacterium]